MKAQLTLRRPVNWQDFESLVKKLWGEIWDCPDIRKNGRSGNKQDGVDVYGIPNGEKQYYGIQCKGKDEYTNKQFTEKEIEEEIEKAKKFQPPLKKLYLTTTAVKNSKIEEFVRKKNVEHLEKGLFGVEIYSWEDIVELIDENKRTYDWYVKSQNYKANYNVSVTFQNGSTEILCIPKFKKQIIQYKQKIVPANNFMAQNSLFDNIIKQQQAINRLTVVHTPWFTTKINLSYFSFSLRVHNTGINPIEEYKLLLEFQGDVENIADTNEKSEGIVLANISSYIPNTFLWNETKSGKIVPRNKILVSDDTFISDEIFIKTKPIETRILIKWKLLSKEYKDEGELIINVQPDIEYSHKEILVEDPTKIRVVENEIEEYIIEKKDDD